MRASPILEIMARLDNLDVDETARRALRTMVREVCTDHGIVIDRYERAAFVRRLIAARVSRPTIRDRLIAMYGVSRRQAYLLIADGLNCANHAHFSARDEAILAHTKSEK
jgi:hypothetical protein